jgi:hypothetical protein
MKINSIDGDIPSQYQLEQIQDQACSNCGKTFDLDSNKNIFFVETSKGVIVWWHRYVYTTTKFADSTSYQHVLCGNKIYDSL